MYAFASGDVNIWSFFSPVYRATVHTDTVGFVDPYVSGKSIDVVDDPDMYESSPEFPFEYGASVEIVTGSLNHALFVETRLFHTFEETS